MKLNRIKEVLDEKGISQTWLAKKLDKSVNQGILHKNNAARKKSQLALKLAKIDA